MVWLPAELDPQGEMAYQGTLLLLSQMARDAESQNLLADWMYKRPPTSEDSWKKERRLSFALWQLATNPNPNRVIGQWWMSTREPETRYLSFVITAHCSHPADEARYSLYCSKALNLHFHRGLDAFKHLWSWPDTHKSKELTTGKLAEILELLSQLREWDPMPEELRRDLVERVAC